jgi:hypothetical protein
MSQCGRGRAVEQNNNRHNEGGGVTVGGTSSRTGPCGCAQEAMDEGKKRDGECWEAAKVYE